MVKGKNLKKDGKGKSKGKIKSSKKSFKKEISKKNRNRKIFNPKSQSLKFKSSTTEDLITELNTIEETKRLNPSSNVKNKEMRKNLVLLRNMKKKLIKGKLRRKNQKDREENPELEKEIPLTKTIDNQREHDETYINKDDEELIEENQNDEFSSYFNNEYEPQIMITTAIKYTASVFKFIKELVDTIPNSYFYYRKNFTLKEIVEFAKEKTFSHIIVIQERVRKPYRMIITHLPEGPTLEFKISNIFYHDEIPNKAKVTPHKPEVILKNFTTKIGHRTSRLLNSIFPQKPDLEGRRVVTFHNQRDYIFFRHHRYIFSEDYKNVHLQEIGPRFTLRLLSIQKGTFDNEFGEHEWVYKNSMGVRRRKFYL